MMNITISIVSRAPKMEGQGGNLPYGPQFWN